MSLVSKAKEVLNKLPSEKQLGVAVSGGSDSMCLLAFLLYDSGIDKSNLTVLNVEHGIRGQASKKDTEFVKIFCEKEKIKFETISLDVPAEAKLANESIETNARNSRHLFFKSFIDNGTLDYILLAHNIHDKTESVLMHIFRGCGINGLIGMQEIDGYMARPLLNVSKDEILNYLKEHNVDYVTDETNKDNHYSRNYLRNEIIPKIKNIYPGLDEAIKKLSSIAKEHDFQDSEELEIENIDGNKVRNAFIKAGLTHDFTKKHIDSVVRLAGSQSGQKIDLPHSYYAIRLYDKISILKKKNKNNIEISFDKDYNILKENGIEIKMVQPIVDKHNTIVDLDKIPGNAVFRTRRNGDRFCPVCSHEKLLSDYFTDKKIPVVVRDNIILLASGKNVLCLPGMAVSENIKIDKTTKNAALITISENGGNNGTKI